MDSAVNNFNTPTSRFQITGSDTLVELRPRLKPLASGFALKVESCDKDLRHVSAVESISAKQLKVQKCSLCLACPDDVLLPFRPPVEVFVLSLWVCAQR